MVRPPLRSRSLICSQICPRERPSQVIDIGARCHSGCPGTRAGSKFAGPWHVLQGRVEAPCPERPSPACVLLAVLRKRYTQSETTGFDLLFVRKVLPSLL